MPMLKRKSVLAVKVESIPGTAENLTVSDAAFNAFDVAFSQSFEVNQREQQGSFQMLPADVSKRIGKVTFKTELYADAAEAIQAESLLPACGFKFANGAFTVDMTPVDISGSGQKTLTIGGYHDGQFVKLFGCQGNAKLTFEASKRVLIDWDFTGIWGGVSDVAIVSPTYPTETPLKFVSSNLTYNSKTPVVNQLTLDIGNTVDMREDSTTASGFSHAIIVDRLSKISIDPEAVLTAAHDVWGNFLTGTEAAIGWSAVAGDASAAFSATKAQIVNLSWADRNKKLTNPIDLQVNSDDLSITFTPAGS